MRFHEPTLEHLRQFFGNFYQMHWLRIGKIKGINVGGCILVTCFRSRFFGQKTGVQEALQHRSWSISATGSIGNCQPGIVDHWENHYTESRFLLMFWKIFMLFLMYWSSLVVTMFSWMYEFGTTAKGMCNLKFPKWQFPAQFNVLKLKIHPPQNGEYQLLVIMKYFKWKLPKSPATENQFMLKNALTFSISLLTTRLMSYFKEVERGYLELFRVHMLLNLFLKLVGFGNV